MYCSMSGKGSARSASVAIAAYAPGSLSPRAAGFARGVVGLAAPGTAARAKALLFAASRLAAFAERVGLELSPGVLLSEAVIERLVLVGCEGLAAASVRTVRTNLRALARSLERYPEPMPTPLARERAKAPYSPAEIDAYLRLAGALSTRRRRIRASALVCLGAGAGVIAGELRDVRGSDVVERAGGVIVMVSGRRARSVPVLAGYWEPLLEAAAFAGERFIVGGREPGRRNITDELCALLSSDPSLPRLESGRLRSTWLTACAELIGLAGFMQAAGISCSQRLGDLVALLPAASEADLVALLGGRR
jgi:integrase